MKTELTTTSYLGCDFVCSNSQLRTEKELYRLSCKRVPYSTHGFLGNKKEPFYWNMLVPGQTGTHVDLIGIVTWTSFEFEQTSIRARTGPRVRRFYNISSNSNSELNKFHIELHGGTLSHGVSTTDAVISKFDADTSSHFEFEQTKSQPK